MKQKLRIALAQINCTVGDLNSNRDKILFFIKDASSLKADIVVFPELAVTGYPPEDLLLKPKFIKDNLDVLKDIVAQVKDIIVVVGFVDRSKSNLYNGAAVIHNGKIKGVAHKVFLPNYGVFDEKRYFYSGAKPLVLKIGGLTFGVNICEDIWHKEGPTKLQAKLKAKLILNINASPYYAGRIKEREEIIRKQAKANKVFIAYTNLVGGQDELIFDGQSMIVDAKGRIIGRAEAFKEDILVRDLDLSALSEEKKPVFTIKSVKPLDRVAEVYQALVLGLKDYVLKNGFEKVIIGLSGGIDSSLVATLAVDALGKENVTGIFMPTRHSSKESEEYARKLAVNLGIRFSVITIDQTYNMYLAVLDQHFAGTPRNITEENLQARIRGNIIMAFSNKFGWMVLTTGNKSEMSTGYATLYGDMAGGLAVIKDVPKILVYKLSGYRNSIKADIPEEVITRPPTAELRPNQKDSDTLPPYEVLDPILKAYVEEDKELDKIVKLGFDKATVERVLRMVDKSEYKRRQSPPGLKITPKAFGRDRRMPITNKYKG